MQQVFHSFKPYYNWITFNTEDIKVECLTRYQSVLNLIITGLPSIQL